jgi:hypothetical protein
MEGEEERQRDAWSVEYGELPELTRGLRALGSARHDARALQTVFFQPLMDARRKAADAREADAKVKAFDGKELARQLDRIIERIIGDWPDARPSARRAVRAQLQERVAPYADALAELDDRAAELRESNEGNRLTAWRAWTSQLAAVFTCADRSWISLQSAARSLPPKPAR